MNVEWLLNKAKEKFYPITHAKAVVTGNGNETVSDAITGIKSSISNKANNSIVSDVWSNTTTYAVGQYCIYNNALWKCKVAHNGQTPAEGTYWTKVSVSNEISSLNSSLSKVKTYVGEDGKLHFIDSAGADSVLPFSNGISSIVSYTSEQFCGNLSDNIVDVTKTITNSSTKDRFALCIMTPNINTYTIYGITVTNGSLLTLKDISGFSKVALIKINKNSTATITFNQKHYSPGNAKYVDWTKIILE